VPTLANGYRNQLMFQVFLTPPIKGAGFRCSWFYQGRISQKKSAGVHEFNYPAEKKDSRLLDAPVLFPPVREMSFYKLPSHTRTGDETGTPMVG